MKNSGIKGITLLEIIIAMYLVAFAFAALVAFYPAVYRHATMSKNRFIASSVARGTVDSIKAVPWGQPFPSFLKQPQGFVQVIEGEKHPIVFKIREIRFDPPNSANNGADPNSHVCEVTVVVEWEEGTGAASEMKRRTITSSDVISRE